MTAPLITELAALRGSPANTSAIRREAEIGDGLKLGVAAAAS
jgi:hypothetical protein